MLILQDLQQTRQLEMLLQLHSLQQMENGHGMQVMLLVLKLIMLDMLIVRDQLPDIMYKVCHFQVPILHLDILVMENMMLMQLFQMVIGIIKVMVHLHH